MPNTLPVSSPPNPASVMIRSLLTQTQTQPQSQPQPAASFEVGNSSRQPGSSRAPVRYTPYSSLYPSLQSRRRAPPSATFHCAKEPEMLPLDLSVKRPVQASVPSAEYVKKLSDTPFVDHFLHKPNRERENLYLQMMQRTSGHDIYESSSNYNGLFEKRAVAECYRMGIPIYHPLIIKDVVEKTSLTAEKLEPAAVYFTRAYCERLPFIQNLANRDDLIYQLLGEIAEEMPAPLTIQGAGEEAGN